MIKIKDFFCTDAAMDKMRTMTPNDFTEYLEDMDAPKGYIMISDWETVYLCVKSDFQADSPYIDEDDNLFLLEYFENGIPDWVGPKPGLRTYYADWTGSDWTFTKASGI